MNIEILNLKFGLQLLLQIIEWSKHHNTSITTHSMRWFSHRGNPMPHFWGCAPEGLWPPNSNWAEIFV